MAGFTAGETVSGAPVIPIPGPLHPSRLLHRPNRFLLLVCLENGRERGGASGRPGASPGAARTGAWVWLRAATSPTRKTGWTAVLVEGRDRPGLVLLDTTLPNRLIRSALEGQALPELEGWKLQRAEVPLGSSRLDFLLSRGDGRRMALEVKSVTFVEDGVGLFPDAVTGRGARHLAELARIAERPGWEAVVLFVLQRADAREIQACRRIDSRFADALCQAKRAGVRVLGRRCVVCLDGVELGAAIPADAGPPDPRDLEVGTGGAR